MTAPRETTVEPRDLDAYNSGDQEWHLDGALRAVRSYCRWHVGPVQTSTVTLRSEDGATLMLPTLRLVEVQAVTYRQTSLDLNTVTWDPSGIVTASAGSRYADPVTVQFTHGYDELPEDVRQVVVALAQGAIDNPSRRLRTEIPGTLADTFAAVGAYVLTQHDKDLLDPYRLISVG